MGRDSCRLCALRNIGRFSQDGRALGFYYDLARRLVLRGTRICDVRAFWPYTVSLQGVPGMATAVDKEECALGSGRVTYTLCG